MKNIVILGGSYGGVSTAHRILKQAPKNASFKITLVAPNTHFYWNMASPRGIVPGQLTDEQLFQPIAPGFSQYPSSQFEFIVATADSLDVDSRRVGISGSPGQRNLDYDFLILATGSSTKEGMPFKNLGNTEETKAALHKFQAQIKKAETIAIAGAGVTGVELAGELAFEYKRDKEIILLSSGTTILEGMPSSTINTANDALKNLNVGVTFQKRVTSVAPTHDGRQQLTFSTGEISTVDMYIPTFGLTPNSSYIPSKYLNDQGFVIVDEYLKMKGAENVWAVGDVSDAEWLQFMWCDKQSANVAKQIASVLGNKVPSPYKSATTRFIGLSISKNAGTGHSGNWKIPSFVIVYFRKNLFRENMLKTIDGSLF